MKSNGDNVVKFPDLKKDFNSQQFYYENKIINQEGPFSNEVKLNSNSMELYLKNRTNKANSMTYFDSEFNILNHKRDIYKATTREEDLNKLNDDKNDIRDAEQRIHQTEIRINETEKRIYQNNKDLENRIDKHFDDLKNVFKDYKNDVKEEIKVHNEHNECHIKKIEENISKLESRIDSTNKWIIGLCITTIIGIATMAITIMSSK